MSSRRVSPNVIKLHRCYTVSDLADRLEVHKNTVRNWQKRGLSPIDDSRPVLFQGTVVRDFLRGEKITRKAPCGPGRFYCLHCRAPRSPAAAMVDYLPITLLSGNLRAICECCGMLMHRRASMASVADVMPGIAVQTVQAP